MPELHRGKLARHPRILAVRPLVRDDLACLREKRVGAPRLKTFRDTHHRLARLVAAGLRPAEILRRTGFGSNRLNQLNSDPAFQQLVAEYRGKVDEAFINSLDEFYETATSNMLRAERRVEQFLDEREDDGEPVSLNELKALTTLIGDRADRFGYGKHHTQRNENVDFAAMMKQIAQRSGRSNVIDANRVDAPQGRHPALFDPVEPESSTAVGFRRRA